MILGLKFILLLLCANAFAKPGFIKEQLNNAREKIHEKTADDDMSEESKALVRKWLDLIGISSEEVLKKKLKKFKNI